MKYIRIIVAIIFTLIIVVPVVNINTEPEFVSEVDNRMLAENPFSDEVRNREDADLTKDIENYLGDRIGFRDKMLLANVVINDKFFERMEHPTYDYGTDGYVFFRGWGKIEFDEYHIAFADMVKSIQDYCEERNVPFLFVFDPEKTAVYSEYIPDGVNYDRKWVELFFNELDKRDVHYLDNTPVLIEKKNQGEVVFNQKYNAGHWNDLGAYYGVNNILLEMQKSFPGVELNEMDDYTVEYERRTSLLVSEFPIDEKEPVFTLKNQFEDYSTEYGRETERHPNYQRFNYTVMPEKKAQGSPKTLVFQGSYMNGMGYKFFENSLGEYIYVHDYQNVIDFPYYFNLYKPEYVIFEVAEYTFDNAYFNYDNMKKIHYNPLLSNELAKCDDVVENECERDSLSYERGELFTKITWKADELYDNTWFTLDEEFDMKLVDEENKIYEITIPNDKIDGHKNDSFIAGEADHKIELKRVKDI